MLRGEVLRPRTVLLSDREEQLKFWGQLVLRVKTIREIYATYAAVRMDLYPCNEEYDEVNYLIRKSIKKNFLHVIKSSIKNLFIAMLDSIFE